MEHITGYIIALDQGTTSSRSILYDLDGRELKLASRPLTVTFPDNGWVEQDPWDIWQTQLESLLEVADNVPVEKIRAIGITNQRETIIVWDPRTGEPLAPAIVWQCRRSAPICERLREQGVEAKIKEKTGLVLDAYFSATKITWLIENIPGLAKKVSRGQAVFGTVDSWLLFNLTKDSGQPAILTEPSNASRTMLFSLSSGDWDEELLTLFSLSRSNLPRIVRSQSRFGVTSILSGATPITAILGDQQASLFGHRCFGQQEIKCTFGTGAFLLMNTGSEIVRSEHGLLSTVAWEETGRKLTYAIEGSVFVAGALIQWLRDKLKILGHAADSEELAASVSNNGGVMIVPAFVGLGAPHWLPEARGAILGLTRESSNAHLARAALEAVAHQVADLLTCPHLSTASKLKIDGGMSANRLFCQILADLIQKPVEVSPRSEVTAFGIASLAAMGTGRYANLNELSSNFGDHTITEDRLFTPKLPQSILIEQRKRWQEAVNCVSRY